VLVVEDDEKIAASVRRGLQAEGYLVDVVADGETGLLRATTGGYDLVLLDLMLPRLNGYRVCAELRARGVDVPVLMLTAKSGDLDEAEGLDTGADDFLTKPFSFAVLSARIRALLRRSARAEAGPSTVGRLVVDLASRRATLADAPIELTRRELDVLAFLAERSGNVVSKRDLIDALWDPAFDGDDNVVEVYVGRLRRKLAAAEPDAASVVIETVRGAGYRMEAAP
jgi:DNA-binding response OmpR family regulator